MCQIEEFNKYISRQVEDDENQEYPEEQGEEENLEEEEESANNEIQMKIVQKSKQIIDASNQLNTEHKKYKTYSTFFIYQRFGVALFFFQPNKLEERIKILLKYVIEEKLKITQEFQIKQC